jgi:CheY-like chemotaxis protein
LSIVQPDSPVLLDADVTRLSQVFVNLLTNAAKYTERGGRIELMARLESHTVTVTVTDDGVGIPAGQLDRVFDMFSQVEGTVAKSRGGLGIGLSLVKHLVTLHGGSIRAHSDGPGTGSTFTVALPLSPGAHLARPKADGPHLTDRASVGSQLRILVVEDHQDGAETITALLSQLGHDVRAVRDGDVAVQAASAFHPELILLDIGLPSLSGYEVCRQIRAQAWGTGITIVAMTGWGDPEAQREARAAGFDRHLVKPIDEQSLVEALALAAPHLPG